jgi:hypothetical protein
MFHHGMSEIEERHIPLERSGVLYRGVSWIGRFGPVRHLPHDVPSLPRRDLNRGVSWAVLGLTHCEPVTGLL